MKPASFPALCLALILLILPVSVHAQSIDNMEVTPNSATSNSVFTFSFNWHEETHGMRPDAGTLVLAVYTPYVGWVWIHVPEECGKGWSYQPEGRKYTMRLTSGLNLANNNVPYPVLTSSYASRGPELYIHPNEAPPMTDPSTWGNAPPIMYFGGFQGTFPYWNEDWDLLHANGDGTPRTITVQIRGWYTPPPENPGDPPPLGQEIKFVFPPVTVHDSHPVHAPANAAYLYKFAGMSQDRDWLWGYIDYAPGGDPLDWDPLATEGITFKGEPWGSQAFQRRFPDDAQFPDNGTTSTHWTYKAIYQNDDGLPPIPYIPTGLLGGAIGNNGESVHLRTYDENTGVYLYIRNRGLNSQYVALPMQKENSEDNDYSDGVIYRFDFEPGWGGKAQLLEYGLPVGRYEYFFGCSDDYIRDAGGNIYSWLEQNPMAPGSLSENHTKGWRQIGNFYNVPWVADPLGYLPGGYGYIDRPTYRPGVTTGYDYPANVHPDVTLGLYNGYLTPYYSMVNPDTGLWTPGGTTATEFTFYVTYQQIDGIAPEDALGAGGEISLWINNNAVNHYPTSSDLSTQYTRYTLSPPVGFDKLTPAQRAAQIKVGAVYHTTTPITLPAGGHSFFFTASDGQRRVHYPTEYPVMGGGTRHAFRGPRINNRAILSEPRVDPQMGTAGDLYRYSVLYTDPDNQRPYSAEVVIKWGDGANDILRGKMQKFDQTDDNYKDGCKYVFDSANLAQKLQPGQRQFYFEFVDDWGPPTDPTVHIIGEKSWSNGAPNWISGPFIGANQRPTLTLGSLSSTDGTSNIATLWKYSVRYTDLDNHNPKYVSVYIGQAVKDVDGNVTSITWDNGHDMQEADPTDKVYANGKDYYYSTRLQGSDAGIAYYYTFVASDGIDVAQYNATTSPSADTVWETVDANGIPLYAGERLSPTDPPTNTVFRASHFPLVAGIQGGPGQLTKPYTFPIVYDSLENQLTAGLDYTIDYISGAISLVRPNDNIYARYWFAVAGPDLVGANTPPTLKNGQVSPDPGTSADTYTFSVVYQDQDGPYGQAPYFIRLKLDPGDPGSAREIALTPIALGTPNFKTGVKYETSIQLTPGLHRYYFEASDGAGYAVYDKNGNRSSNGPILGFVPWEGPYVNDPPTLTQATIYPNPPGGINIFQWVIYSVVYTDANNEPPDSGYPVVYVDNTSDQDYTAVVSSVTDNVLTVSSQSTTWADDQFKGEPLQMTTGLVAGSTYIIMGNTSDSLTLLATDLSLDISPGDTLSIKKLIMTKTDATDNDYTGTGVLYEVRIPGLGEGSHQAHFKAVTTETISAAGQTRQTTIRNPVTGELPGPAVTKTPPVGNTAPVLSNSTVTSVQDVTGLIFNISVKYTDADGDPPALNNVERLNGFIRVVIDGTSHDMVTPAVPNYVTGAVCTYSVSGLSVGSHQFHFEASDGWFFTRLPVTGELALVVNQPPTLTLGTVVPPVGNVGTVFEYKVRYTDSNNNMPSTIKLVIDMGQATEQTIEMGVPMPGIDFSQGFEYVYPLPRNTLSIGSAHTYYFEGEDGNGGYAVFDSDGSRSSDLPILVDPITGPIPGPIVHANTAPSLETGIVTPASGWETDEFIYSVKYSDEDGDEPEYVKVYIDEGSSDAQTLVMTKAPAMNDFRTGVTYTLSKSDLTAGSHTYYFTASDWLAVARFPASGVLSGPNVTARQLATVTIGYTPASPSIGNSIQVSGRVTDAQGQGLSVPLKIKRTSPNAAVVEISKQSAVNGSYSYSWVPDVIGRWKAKATWAGDSHFLPSESPEILIDIVGPSVTVNGLDMISVPLTGISITPEGVFGGDPPFALAKWLPAKLAYKLYSLLPGIRSDWDFVGSCPITTGQAYWIKTLVPKVVAPSGGLLDVTQDFGIPLSAGWNQIGCPFNRDVEWGSLLVRYAVNGVTSNHTLDEAAAAGWVKDYGWMYDKASGNYALVRASTSNHTLIEWKGYWLKANASCTLVVPGFRSVSAQLTTSSLEADVPSVLDNTKWQVIMTASNGELSDKFNFFGASRMGDERIESPACFEGFVDLYFTTNNGGMYADDLRGNLSTGDSWLFNVDTDREGEVLLEWDGLEKAPGSIKLVLVDLAENKSIEIAPGGSYRFSTQAGGGSRSFRIDYQSN